MEIDKATEKKIALEQAIFKLATEFVRETGLEIVDIRLNSVEPFGSVHKQPYGCAVEVRL
jgi:hypothetical protein